MFTASSHCCPVLIALRAATRAVQIALSPVTGISSSSAEAVSAGYRPLGRAEPDPAHRALYDELYERYQALTGSQEPVTAMLNEYRIRRDKLMEMFAVDPRFECAKPAGAFYLFPRVTKVLESTGTANTGDFSQMLLDEARVALTAGEGFDAPGFLRISYATSLDRLREGTTRILEFVKKRERQGAAVR